MTDPFAPPESDIAGATTAFRTSELGPVQFEVEPVKGGKWRASFHPEHVRVFHAMEDRELVYAREDLPAKSSLVFMPGGAIGLTLRGGENVVVTVPKSEKPALRAWIDPIATEMMRAPFVKSRATRGIFTGIFGALWLTNPTSFMAFFALWNGVLFGASFLPPSRYLFLVQGLFSTCFVAYFAYGIVEGRTPWWIGLLALIVLLAALSSFRLYGFFGRAR